MNTHLKRKNIRGPAALFATALSLALLSTAFAQNNQRYDNNYNNEADLYRTSLPSGTVIPVRLDTPLSSKTSVRGERFMATVVSGPDDAGLPSGTRLEGVVRESIRSANGEPGSLDVDFPRIVFPDGSSQAITASFYSLSGKAIKRTDGRLVATSDKSKDRLKFIGIGAGAGLLLGTLTKNNSILSLLLGAGAGYLYNEYGAKVKPGDVDLKQGQEFGVRLDRQFAMNAQTRRYYRRQAQVSPGTPQYSPYGEQVRVTVDDRQVRFTNATRPYIRNGVVFVPLAVMGSAADFNYRYDSQNRTVYARSDEVRAAIGSRIATVNGERRTMPAAPEIRNGVTFVPLQFIEWAADGTVGFDEAGGRVTITTNP